MINWILIKIIRVYQKGISPFLPPSCRFYPSCSEYAIEALKRFGLVRALIRIGVRLSKCHPYHDGGFDPVP